MKKQNKMKNKLSLFFVFAFLGFLLLASNVLSETWEEDNIDVVEMQVYVNSNIVWHGRCWGIDDSVYPHDYDGQCSAYQRNIPALERGEDMDVKVVFKTAKNLYNVRVKAWINGYREDIEDKTGIFDAFKDNQYSKVLFLPIPDDIDARDTYTLYVKIESNEELNGVDEARIDTSVQRSANLLEILSVDLYDHSNFYQGVCGTCSVTFEAGTTVYADVVVKNTGNHIAEDVYVKLSIPELCIERTVYLGDLGSFDSRQYEDTEQVTIALPLPGDEGTYELVIEAYNSEMETEETRTLILERELERDVEILPQITEASVNQGETAKYSLIVTNLGESYESFIVEVLGADGWSTVRVSPASFSLAEGESRLVNVYLDINDNTETGTYPFTVRVKYGTEAKQFNFNTEVRKSTADWKWVLVILGIILAIGILVLLILLLVRQTSSEEERPETVESYY